MKTLNHEGEEYVLKSDIENAFKERIQKLSSRAIAAEDQLKTLQDQIDTQSGELAKVEKLNAQLMDMQTQLDNANNRYSRHTAMAEAGFTDSDIRDLVEWQYEKAMQNKAKKDQVPLQDWIKEIKTNPDMAPLALRPHIKTDAVTTEAIPQTTTPVATTEMPKEQPVILPPKTNAGAQQAPVQSTDMLKRGTEDFEFYKANRDAIKKAWSQR